MSVFVCLSHNVSLCCHFKHCQQHSLHKIQHDSLRHHINHCPPHNIIIAGDQQFNHLHLLRLLFAQCTARLERRRWGLHGGHFLFILAGEETAEEPTVIAAVHVQARRVTPRWDGGRRERFTSLRVHLDRFGGIVFFVDNGHGAVTVEEVRVASVDVTGFHGNEISNEFVRWVHCSLVEVDDDGVEFLLQLRVSSEERLVEELTQDADEFIIDETDAFQAWFFEALNLLLNDDFECCCANKEGRRGARRVVEDRADVDVFDLVEGVDGFDAV